MSRRLAKNFQEQCLKGKYFGRFGKNGGTWRCQLKKGHDGNHVDAFGREWPKRDNEIPVDRDDSFDLWLGGM
jgi:hypothetical protein